MTGAHDTSARAAALNQALDYLYSLRTFGVKPGLQRTRDLLDAMGAPDRACQYLHIAGTNGKGSTAAMLASILQAAGIRTGLFTSPHLIRFTERIRVNGIEIDPADVLRILDRIKIAVREICKADTADHPTFFEIITVLASAYFAEQGCKAVVWETGLGGRLDSTNAVHTVASIITSVAMDHCQWLGSTIKQIAAEKAGIIKTSVPVFLQDQPDEVMDVIKERACEIGTTCQTVKWPDQSLAGVQILPGLFQDRNAALAAAVARWYLGRVGTCDIIDHIDRIDHIICKGLESADWPGRFQMICEDPQIILDCAHNQDAFRTLMDAVGRQWPGSEFTLVCGMMLDKDIQGIIKEIPKTCSEIWHVQLKNDRAANFSQFIDVIVKSHIHVPVHNVHEVHDVHEALTMIKGAKGSGKRFMIAGSCYLAGEILALMAEEQWDYRGSDPLRHTT